MINDVIKHGHSYIWDMEIDSYKDVFLHDFYDDTTINFEYLHCEEMYIDMHGLKRRDNSTWEITIPIKCFDEIQEFETACREMSKHCDFLISYSISKQKFVEPTITILIDKDMSIYEAFYYAISKMDAVIDYTLSLRENRLSNKLRLIVDNKLPVYHRAMKKVELELSNFTTDDSSNIHKIIEISSRVKTIDSIQEKVYRKNICQFELFERFDDIAGVRCTCEFLNDVYDVLEYIKQNPLFNVQSIEDKIINPSQAGYRGIHIIVTTDVYYKGSVYNNIKVEIQLRTAFQNAWSMKTHQLTYKQKSIPVDISETMKMMSDALNEADNAAQKIRNSLRHL
ncbi:MAG: GTP pyrophosphokinase family protein [Ruminococcus callidus]